MEPVRSVLYLDFDNVFSGLARLDPRLAMRFVEEPELWLGRLAAGSQDAVQRRWLVLRCYMNPAGWIPHPENDGARLYFSKFRPYFTDAGFEVVDCPRLSHTKNGADIRLVIDAVEALQAEVRYEEFVVASGDSDMTPLLVRLRSSDRRTTILSPSDSAVVLGAVADRMIGGEELLELLDAPVEGADVEADNPETDPEGSEGEDVASEGLSESEARSRFGELVADLYAAASEPLNLAKLAHEVRGELGSAATATRWFGHGGFARALHALDLPSAQMSQHFIWDSTRHSPPVGGDSVRPGQPEPVARVIRVLKLPSLPTSSWRGIFDSLAEFVATYEFNLTEATRWSRDRLAEDGLRVNRQAVSIVASGATYGGCPLYRRPPPGAEEIAAAFVKNVLDRAAAADVDLTSEDAQTVRSWLGAP